MQARGEWVQLAYRLPREPSTPRIAVWRRLRRLGVVQIVDGLVALPRDSRTQEQLEWLADEILEANGEATVWIATPGSAAHERALAQRMSESIAAEYRAVFEAAGAARATDAAARRRTLARLRRALHAIRARDYFPPPEREQAQHAVAELGALVEEPVG
jgi:predicted exporter